MYNRTRLTPFVKRLLAEMAAGLIRVLPLQKEETAMKDTLAAGLEHTFSFTVTREKTVPFVYPESDLFREMPEVFATAYMVGFMEWACMEALRPYLDEGERTLGTMINVTHQAATPPGMTVTARVKCLEVDGKRTLWQI